MALAQALNSALDMLLLGRRDGDILVDQLLLVGHLLDDLAQSLIQYSFDCSHTQILRIDVLAELLRGAQKLLAQHSQFVECRTKLSLKNLRVGCGHKRCGRAVDSSQ